MTPTEALARALRDLLAAADKHAKFGNYPGVEEWDDAYDKAVLALASIEQAAEERSSESGDPDTRGRASGFAPSSAAVAPLDVEALAAALDAETKGSGWAHWLDGVWPSPDPARPEFRRNACLSLAERVAAAYADAIRSSGSRNPSGGGA